MIDNRYSFSRPIFYLFIGVDFITSTVSPSLTREKPIPKPRRISVPLQLSQEDEAQLEGHKYYQEHFGRDKLSTDEHASLDDNLVCQFCYRQFRKGEIQKLKKHFSGCEKKNKSESNVRNM